MPRYAGIKDCVKMVGPAILTLKAWTMIMTLVLQEPPILVHVQIIGRVQRVKVSVD